MKKTDLLALLEDLCERLSIRVRYDRFFGRGGYCKLKDRGQFIINQQLSNEAKEAIFISELRSLDLQDIFVPPKVREHLDQRS